MGGDLWILKVRSMDTVSPIALLTAGSLLNGEIWVYYYYGFHNKYIMYSSHMLIIILFTPSVVSNSLWPYGLQHTRLPCPSPSPGACSNSCPLSQWCHPTISTFVVPFSSCPQSFLASGYFLMNWLFISGGQIIQVSASASVLPMNSQCWLPLGLSGWIPLKFKRLSRCFSNATVQEHQCYGFHLLYGPTLTSIHDYWKNNSFD